MNRLEISGQMAREMRGRADDAEAKVMAMQEPRVRAAMIDSLRARLAGTADVIYRPVYNDYDGQTYGEPEETEDGKKYGLQFLPGGRFMASEGVRNAVLTNNAFWRGFRPLGIPTDIKNAAKSLGYRFYTPEDGRKRPLDFRNQSDATYEIARYGDDGSWLASSYLRPDPSQGETKYIKVPRVEFIGVQSKAGPLLMARPSWENETNYGVRTERNNGLITANKINSPIHDIYSRGNAPMSEPYLPLPMPLPAGSVIVRHAPWVFEEPVITTQAELQAQGLETFVAWYDNGTGWYEGNPMGVIAAGSPEDALREVPSYMDAQVITKGWGQDPNASAGHIVGWK